MRPMPPPATLAEPVEALLAGDTGPFIVLLEALDAWPLPQVERAWWELSTLYGAVLGQVMADADGALIPCTLCSTSIPMTGGAPRRLAEPDALARAWRKALAEPPCRERHRHNLASELAAQRAGRHEQPDAADALLRHHTELPVDFLAGRRPVGAEYGRSGTVAERELADLDAVLASSGAFMAHLQAGLVSPSLPRRDLAWRLLQLATEHDASQQETSAAPSQAAPERPAGWESGS